jgi:hypothetical protein
MLGAYSAQIHSCVRWRFNRLIIDYIVILSLTAYSLVVDAAPIQSASFFHFCLHPVLFLVSKRIRQNN